MAFDSLDIQISGDSADAVATIQSVKASLGGLERSANDAEDSVEEMGDSVTRSSASMTSLAATAGASALSVVGLASASSGASASMTALAASVTGTVVAIGALTALLAPLVVALGGLAVAAGSIAGVFGLIAGATVATQFESIKEAAIDAKEGILGAVNSIGESFLPVLVDLIERLPYVADRIVRALGPLDPFVEAFEDLGNAILDALPGIVAFAADLTRDVLPGLRQFGAVMADLIPGAVRGMVSAGRALGGAIINLATALRNFLRSQDAARIFDAINDSILPLIPLLGDLQRQFGPVIRQLVRELPTAIRAFGTVAQDLIELGTSVAAVVAPALRAIVAIVGDLLAAFNRLPPSLQKLTIAALALGPAISALGTVLSGVVGAVLAVSGAVGTLVGVAQVLAPILAGVVSVLGGPLTAALVAGAAAVAAYKTNFLGFRDAVHAVIEEVKRLIDWLAEVPADVLGVNIGAGGEGDDGDSASRSRSRSRGSRSRVPSLDTGGRIVEGGLARVHSGEQVVPAAQVDRGGGGGVSPAALQEALAGMELSLSGGLSVDGGVATPSDVRAELRRAGREADNRGIN